MTWPASPNFVTSNVDAGSDDPSLARADILALMQDVEDIISGRGEASGVAPLDAGSLLPPGNLPVVPVSKGGTGATTVADARTALGAQTALGFTPVNIAGDTMSDTLTISNGVHSGLTPLVSLEQTTDVATGPSLWLSLLRPNGANDDEAGAIYWWAANAAGLAEKIAKLTAYMRDATAASEDGELRLSVAVGSSLVDILKIDGSGMELLSGSLQVPGFIGSTGGFKRLAANFDKSNDAALAGVTGLSVTVAAAGVYHFRAQLFVSPDTAGGFKAGMGGTATATSILYHAKAYDNASDAYLQGTTSNSLGSDISDAGVTSVEMTFEGTIVVNAGGTLTVQFAQKTATPATTSSVLAGSSLMVTKF